MRNDRGVPAGCIARSPCSMEDYPGKTWKQHDRLLRFWLKQAKLRYFDVFMTFKASASLLDKSKSMEAKDALHLWLFFILVNFRGKVLNQCGRVVRRFAGPKMTRKGQLILRLIGMILSYWALLSPNLVSGIIFVFKKQVVCWHIVS